jgi:hypothetical protein
MKRAEPSPRAAGHRPLAPAAAPVPSGQEPSRFTGRGLARPLGARVAAPQRPNAPREALPTWRRRCSVPAAANECSRAPTQPVSAPRTSTQPAPPAPRPTANRPHPTPVPCSAGSQARGPLTPGAPARARAPPVTAPVAAGCARGCALAAAEGCARAPAAAPRRARDCARAPGAVGCGCGCRSGGQGLRGQRAQTSESSEVRELKRSGAERRLRGTILGRQPCPRRARSRLPRQPARLDLRLQLIDIIND